MNNIQKKINFNFVIIFLLSTQLIIFMINSPDEKEVLNYKSNSLEKFTTMIANKKGIDIIKADKMIKINDNKTVLLGNASLENDEYQISSKNVTVDSEKKITSSSNKTKTTNSHGTVISEGFEYEKNTNLMKFNGKSEFRSNDK